jgi:hypothetical protein
VTEVETDPVEPLEGSCLCGGVRYRIEAEIRPAISHCHCAMCRKQHGAVMGSYVGVPWQGFEWTEGSELVTAYQSSPGIERTFCRTCGSTLQWIDRSDEERFGLAAGTLDSDPGELSGVHIFVASKAPWFEITDPLPQYESDT